MWMGARALKQRREPNWLSRFKVAKVKGSGVLWWWLSRGRDLIRPTRPHPHSPTMMLFVDSLVVSAFPWSKAPPPPPPPPEPQYLEIMLASGALVLTTLVVSSTLGAAPKLGRFLLNFAVLLVKLPFMIVASLLVHSGLIGASIVESAAAP